ncbi:MAG: hypothetical protein Q8M62_15190 [Algoriphagus sp.]|jgi:hypothetical protein|nr:hypothetical protein [Algoriphagus sp.]
MKRNRLVLLSGIIMLINACDPVLQEDANHLNEELTIGGNDLNARKGYDLKINQKMFQIYGLTELAYDDLGSEEAIQEAKLFVRKQGREEFIEEMIRKSVKKYDNIILKRGVFLSPEARRNHARMAEGEHEIEYDILAGFDAAAFDVFIKIPDIPGESGDKKYELVKTFRGPGNSGNCIFPLCGGWSVNKPQVMDISDFIGTLIPRYGLDPVTLGEAVNQLEINSGIDPVAIGLLLPAVQKFRDETAGSSRKAEDFALKLLQTLDLEDPENWIDFLQAGGIGALDKFIFRAFDIGEDLDWAVIQLNRAKYEMEMFYLWETFWEENQADPTTGR